MANHDINIDAAQSFISRDVSLDVKTSDGVEGVSNTAIDPKKSRAALLSGLEALMGAVEQGGDATNGSASDANKGKLGGAPPSAPADPTDPTDPTDDEKPSSMPVGMAILEASQKFQNSSNEIIKNLSDMSTEIMDVTTAATKSGADWLKNYYYYGLSSKESSSTGGIGQFDKGTGTLLPAGDTTVKMYIKHKHYYMSIDGGKTFKDIGKTHAIPGTGGFIDQPTQEQVSNVFPGYNWKQDTATVNANRALTYWHSGDCAKAGVGNEVTFDITITAPPRMSDGSGTGIVNSSPEEMQDKLQQYSYIQDINTQRNTQMQAVSALPTELESTIVGSVDKAHDSDSSTLAAVASLGNLIKGWRN